MGHCVQILTRLIVIADADILEDALWGFAYITDSDIETSNRIEHELRRVNSFLLRATKLGSTTSSSSSSSSAGSGAGSDRMAISPEDIRKAETRRSELKDELGLRILCLFF